MKRVILESPYRGETKEEVDRNVRYARAALRDSLMRDEAPIASHLLYTQPGVLLDGNAGDRKRGMEAGWSWYLVADVCVVYTDLGVTGGMEQGIERAHACGVPVVKRSITGTAW